MLSRIISVAWSATTSTTRLQAVRCMSGYAPAPFRTDREISVDNKATMDDLPVPEGSWQEHYSRKSARTNMMFGASMLTFIASGFMLIKSGAVYLHYPPNLKTLNNK